MDPRVASALLLVTALCALGIRAVVTGRPIPAWQPWPEDLGTLPAKLDGAALLFLGLLSLPRRSRRWAALGLAALLVGWIVLLQGSGVARRPASIALWLGVAEVGAVAAGAALLGLSGSRATEERRAMATAARAGFGLCAVVFGMSHFAYADFTAGMVPAWLPFRPSLAYATGVAHVAAGLAILSGIARRRAAGLLATMMGGFVLLVHVPAVIASGGTLSEVTFLFNACSLCGAAWVVASTTPSSRRADPVPSRLPTI